MAPGRLVPRRQALVRACLSAAAGGHGVGGDPGAAAHRLRAAREGELDRRYARTPYRAPEAGETLTAAGARQQEGQPHDHLHACGQPQGAPRPGL